MYFLEQPANNDNLLFENGFTAHWFNLLDGSPDTFDAELGRKITRDNAIQ